MLSQIHAAERDDLTARSGELEERVRQLELDSARRIEESELAAEQRSISRTVISIADVLDLVLMMRSDVPNGAGFFPTLS